MLSWGGACVSSTFVALRRLGPSPAPPPPQSDLSICFRNQPILYASLNIYHNGYFVCRWKKPRQCIACKRWVCVDLQTDKCYFFFPPWSRLPMLNIISYQWWLSFGHSCLWLCAASRWTTPPNKHKVSRGGPSLSFLFWILNFCKITFVNLILPRKKAQLHTLLLRYNLLMLSWCGNYALIEE